MNIGVVGLGLIGASLAKAITDYTEHKVYGYNRTKEVMETALQEKSICGVLDEDKLAECDIVFVSVYPGAAIDYVKQNAGRFKKNSLVIDCCGVKRILCDELFSVADDNGFYFVGGHPMAGLAHSGMEYSTSELFRGSSMILTPQKSQKQAIKWTEKLFYQIGFGRVVYTTPREHDEEIAYTSQLCHLVSNAFIMSDASLKHSGFSAGSFRDLTRVAWLNENMWTELFMLNKDCLITELSSLIDRLNNYNDALCKDDYEKLRLLLRQGRERKEEVSKI